MKLFLLVAVTILTACEREQSERQSVPESEIHPAQAIEDLPKAFDRLLTGIIDAMPEERKAEIRVAESAERMVDHFGMGMDLRNGELNQQSSEVVAYLIKNGIHHRDDLSSIVLLSVNRRLRGEPIELNNQIQYYRDYWEEQDIVAPLDTGCPKCRVDMEIILLGPGISNNYPDRVYFWGGCTEHDTFVYYHKNGWLPWRTTTNIDESGRNGD